MAYIDSLLASGERPIRREHQHWFVLVADAAVRDPRAAARHRLARVIERQPKVACSERAGLGHRHRRRRQPGLHGLADLRWLNEEFVVTTRRVLQLEGVDQQEGHRQLAREDQRRDPHPVPVRPDLRVRRPRHPDGIGERHLASPQAPPGRRLQAGDARGEARARAGAVRRQAAAVAAAAGDPAGLGVPRHPRTRPTPSPRPRRPLRPRARRHLRLPPLRLRPPAPQPPQMSADEVTRTLASLADLHERGAISTEEYEAKKADLLRRL